MRDNSFFHIVFFSAVLALSPSVVLADVRITEIMYDAPGADAGHEWIEVTNTGNSAIDISGYKFFEANTNHALTLKSGTGVLQPKSSAVIADDDVKFKTDWPNFSGTLFDSSFSLSNSGESLAIKDGALFVLDAVSYDPSAGAAGDGNSLHRSGSSFIAGTPTPGIYSEGSENASSSSDVLGAPSTSSEQSAAAPSPGSAGMSILTARIITDAETMVGGGSFFSGSAYGAQGLPLVGTRYLWNFGDGTTGEGQKVFHAYTYPGTYMVILTVASAASTVRARVAVEAVPAHIALTAENDGSLMVHNLFSADLDIGLWTLSRGGSMFVIPEGTLVVMNGAVRFASSTLKLLAGSAKLLYPNGTVAAEEGADPRATTALSISPADGGTEHAAVSSSPVARQTISARTPQPVERPATPPASAAAAADAGVSLPLWGSVSALLALIILGIAAAFYARLPHEMGEAAASWSLPGAPTPVETSRIPDRSETATLAEEFQITDVTPGVEENGPPR